MRRILLTAAAVAALAVPASVATVGLSAPAWAAGSITCTTISGTASTTVTVSGCTGGVTGGSSVPAPATSLATGGTIHWVSGSTTTTNAPTLVATSAKKCPGYVKGGSSNPTADKFSSTVTADTGDGIKVPGKSSGAVCISSTGVISALKPLKAS